MTPLYSPDGKWVAYTVSDNPARWAFSSTVSVVPARRQAWELAETYNRQPLLVGWEQDLN